MVSKVKNIEEFTVDDNAKRKIKSQKKGKPKNQRCLSKKIAIKRYLDVQIMLTEKKYVRLHRNVNQERKERPK